MFGRMTSIRRVLTALALVALSFSSSTTFALDRFPGLEPPVAPERDPIKDPGDVVSPERDPVKSPDDVVLPQRFVRGDADGSGSVELSDAVTTLSNLFLGTKPLGCKAAADSNDDGVLAISDAIHTLGFLFLGGVQMPQPYPACGVDPTADSLGCEESASCRPEAETRAFQITPVKGGYLIDLPEMMVKQFPEQSDMELGVDGRSRGSRVSGVVSKVSATTLLLETSSRTDFKAVSNTVLRLKVPAQAVRMPALGFACSLFVCTCSGDDDCNDLFSGSNCGGDAVCVNDGAGGVWCICWKGAR